MELHSPVVAKKLWNVLRITFFMMRKKGLISKRKMIMDMNLMMKKGKVLRKSLSNIISFHHHHHHHHHHHQNSKSMTQYYEFSCNNSPNPLFFHIPKRSNNKHHHFNLPCIQAPEVLEEGEESEPHFSSELHDHDDDDNEVVENAEIVANKAVVLAPKTPENTFNFRLEDGSSEFAPGEKKSPLLSPFSVRISNYSALDESEEIGNYGQVDDQAEDFIRRFYEQLRTQSRMQLLHYQDL